MSTSGDLDRRASRRTTLLAVVTSIAFMAAIVIVVVVINVSRQHERECEFAKVYQGYDAATAQAMCR